MPSGGGKHKVFLEEIETAWIAMTRQNKPEGPKPGSRDARLAEALRQNLKRRKAADRQRRETAASPLTAEDGADAPAGQGGDVDAVPQV